MSLIDSVVVVSHVVVVGRCNSVRRSWEWGRSVDCRFQIDPGRVEVVLYLTSHPFTFTPTLLSSHSIAINQNMDLAAQENQARAERWEKGVKIGEGTFANVYKGA